MSTRQLDKIFNEVTPSRLVGVLKNVRYQIQE